MEQKPVVILLGGSGFIGSHLARGSWGKLNTCSSSCEALFAPRWVGVRHVVVSALLAMT